MVAFAVPPRCGVCASACAPAAAICAGCERELSLARAGRVRLAGLGEIAYAAPYRGVARRLVVALKFEARIGLAAVAAGAIAEIAPRAALDARATVVPVAPSPWRRRLRGFDPAELIATSLGRALGLHARPWLSRADGARQVGRSRAERLASPPRVSAARCAGGPALLVDDVVTTGSTLRACADALRERGCDPVGAVTFARSVGRAGPPSGTPSATLPHLVDPRGEQ